MPNKKKPNKYQKILDDYFAKASNEEAYAEAISYASFAEKDYIHKHRDELRADQKERADVENGLILPSLHSFFESGKKVDHRSNFEFMGMEREALIKLQKLKVPYKDLLAATEAHPGLTCSQMLDNYRESGTVDGYGHEGIAYTLRRDSYFETVADKVLEKHPEAKQLGDLRSILLDDEIEADEAKAAGVKAAPKKPKIKEEPKHEEGRKTVKEKRTKDPHPSPKIDFPEPSFTFMNSEEAFPVDLGRKNLRLQVNPELTPGDLGNLKLPMVPSDAEWFNTLQKMKEDKSPLQ